MSEVFVPRNMDELWETLEKHPLASVYAGGTDLLVKKRSRCLEPNVLICLECLNELKGVQRQETELFIGATTTHSQLLKCEEIKNGFPVLSKAISVIGSPAIRNMGTIGGNVVTASPAGDSLPVLHILDAEVEVRSRDASRRVKISEFILGPGQVDLKRGEIVAGIWLSNDLHFHIHFYEKVGLRNGMACSVASMAALVRFSKQGLIDKIRLSWGSVGPKIVMLPQVERFLEGKPLTQEALKNVVPIIEQSVSPIDDIRASGEYRRQVAGSLILRLTS